MKIIIQQIVETRHFSSEFNICFRDLIIWRARWAKTDFFRIPIFVGLDFDIFRVSPRSRLIKLADTLLEITTLQRNVLPGTIKIIPVPEFSELRRC